MILADRTASENERASAREGDGAGARRKAAVHGLQMLVFYHSGYGDLDDVQVTGYARQVIEFLVDVAALKSGARVPVCVTLAARAAELPQPYRQHFARWFAAYLVAGIGGEVDPDELLLAALHAFGRNRPDESACQ